MLLQKFLALTNTKDNLSLAARSSAGGVICVGVIPKDDSIRQVTAFANIRIASHNAVHQGGPLH